MKRNIFLFLALLTLGSCQRSCSHLDRDIQFSEKDYNVRTYSGGKLISEYTFKGILNNQQHSDGYFFYQNDTLVEVSGDILVKSW
jgi:hypothetical protein